MSAASSPPATPLLRAALLLGLLAVGGCGSGTTLGHPVGDFPPGVVRGPMLALAAPTSMTIAWTTDVLVVGSVTFGPTASYGTTVADASPVLEHALELSGLLADTSYHYRIELGGVPAGGDHTFTTPPSDPDAPVRFVVLGDTGTGTQIAFDVITRLEAQAPDFVVHVGDLAYNNGTQLDVLERFTIPFAHTLDHLPLYAVLGNHDVKTRNGQPFLDAVVLPTNPADGTERFYSFDWGPCHFVALDSNSDLRAGGKQVTWLDADLLTSTARWKFVFVHHPVWSSSRHGSRPDLQASLSPVLEAHRVDVVWSGHDHDYERTFPLVGPTPVNAGEEPDYASPPGPIYVVTGGGGKGLYESGTSTFTAFSESAYHVTVVDVAGPTLTITAVRVDGTVMDRASITK